MGDWTRAMLKALLQSLLEPTEGLSEIEVAADYTGRLAMREELKDMPYGAVWDVYYLRNDTPFGSNWLDEVRPYEEDVLSNRG